MHIPSQAEMAQIVSQKGLSVVTAVADGAVAVHMAEKYIVENR